jgi:Helicase conserved C-terminal domain/SNF2-related domain/PLD-like domain
LEGQEVTVDNIFPVFATNDLETKQTVADAINKLFRLSRKGAAQAPALAIATAYLNPGGFMVLADEIESAPKVRILLGAEPQEDAVLAHELALSSDAEKFKEAQTKYEAWLVAERDLLGFSREVSKSAERLVAWLRHAAETGEPQVEVRKFNKGFLHGKAFIVDHDTYPAVMAGSSNMTYAGLMRNAELNIGATNDPSGATPRVREWFEKYWDQSEEFDLAAIYEARWDEHQPWTVFLRMLWELYSANLADEEIGETELKLTRFQQEGVGRMLRLLKENNGVLVADEVGLGKTFLAGEVMARATLQDRLRVLIVCPAALESMWARFITTNIETNRIKIYSYDFIRSRSADDHPDREAFIKELDDYAYIVIDEAHNLRNAAAERSKAIDSLLGGLNPKKTILLTATPVNNSLSDLETLIKYFIRNDSYFSGIGIPSISKYIKRAQAIDPDSLSPKMLFDLMDQVSVRRTRKFIKKNYPNDKITLPNGEESPIFFPEPTVYRVDYSLDESGTQLLDAVLYALDVVNALDGKKFDRNDEKRLLLSRYTSSGYLLSGDVEEYQVRNAGLLRSILLKRLESSPKALAHTLKVMAKSHAEFLTALDGGYVLSGEALRDWANAIDENLDEILAGFDEKKKSQVQDAKDFNVEELKRDVTRDLELLKHLRVLAEASAHGAEPKVEALINQLREIAEKSRHPDKNGARAGDRRKVIVFSSYADTVIDVHKHVEAAIDKAKKSDPLSDYKNRLPGQITGADNNSKSSVVKGFAPNTAGDLDDNGKPYNEDLYDILITTDVLAEGVNLQQAGRIINYDLPWNPMRIVQRHGRIDRIGSSHTRVHLGCFFPDNALDKMLKLEATLQRKLAYAAASVGITEVIPGQKNAVDITFADKLKQDLEIAENQDAIKQLYEGNADLLINGGEGNALSGEEYRRRLFNALDHQSLKHEVLRLPFASGSGFVNVNTSQSGYVWCVRMGEHNQPWFAWTPVDENWKVLKDETGTEIVDDDKLKSLASADPSDEKCQRMLTPEAYDAAYDAWAIAQSHVWARWTEMTDAKAFAPDLPKVMRDAIQFVYTAQLDASVEEKQALNSKLNCVPSHPVQRKIRAVLNSELSDKETFKQLVEVVNLHGLQPAEPGKPLPKISINDVRIITWMAVKAGK